VGFTVVGVFREAGYKFEAWHDVGWYERAVSARNADAREPTPLPELPPDVLAAALRG